MSRKTILILAITLIVLIVAFVYIVPVVIEVNAGLRTYETQVAYRDDYKLHTTPLPKSVVDDLCLKLAIKESSEHCQSNAVVYTPDLFDEIKAYFKNPPDQDKTYQFVQEKLGVYLDYCEDPDPDGDYRCSYDLRGDDVYPVFFYFDKHGMYYELIANAGGS